MTALNMKSVASAFAALALTVILSWTFVTDTGLARAAHVASSPGIVASISALVR